MTGRLDWFVNKCEPITARETGGVLQPNGSANINTAGKREKERHFLPGKSLSLLIDSLYFFQGTGKNYPVHFT